MAKLDISYCSNPFAPKNRIISSNCRHNFTQRYDYFDGQWRNVSEILKREDSPLAFSKLTKAYFARRIMRDLRKLGEQASPLYTKYATDILLCFNDAIEKPSPYKQVDYGYFYNSETRS